MKLLRYGRTGKEKPGLLDDQGKIRDLSGVIDDLGGAALLPKNLDKLKKLKLKRSVNQRFTNKFLMSLIWSTP